MQYTSLVTLLAVASAGFFDSGKFDEFKAKLEKSGDNLLDKGGEVRDDVFDLWSPTELNEWLAYHKLDPPHTDNTGALVAKARENKDKLAGDLKDLFNHPPPSEKILTKGSEYYNEAANNVFDAWSNSALASYLTARGQDASNIGDHSKLVELANQYKNAAIDTKNKVSRSWLESWSRDDLEKALKNFGAKAEGTREYLADELYNTYLSAKESATKGQKQGEKHAQDAIKAVEKWQKDSFDSWSLEDLKEYVSQFTPELPSKKDQLVDAARSNWNYFVYGETAPSTLWSQFIRYAHLAEVHLAAGFTGIKNKLLSVKDEL